MSDQVSPPPDAGAAAPRILCCDVDAFYCQAAYLTWPEQLHGVELLLVGGHPAKRGVVASCSYAARQRGVHSAMPMATARRVCPEAVAVPVPWATVRRKSRQVFGVLRRFAERLERVSIDEGYLLLPGAQEPVEAVAHRIRRTVKEETDITLSIGGSTLRYIAKMATRYAKPGSGADGVYIVAAGAEYDFMSRRSLAEIPGVGQSFLQQLERRGIGSIVAARRIDLPTLTLWLGTARARFLYDRIRAIDPNPVSDGREPRKSISSEETFERDILEMEALEEELAVLVTDVGRTLRRSGLRARTISVKLRNSEFRDRQKNRTLTQAVETDRVIFQVARELLHDTRRVHPGYVRLLGVSLSGLEGPGSAEQLTFPQIVPPLETEEDRLEQAALNRRRMEA
jgi:DNA polymerase IV